MFARSLMRPRSNPRQLVLAWSVQPELDGRIMDCVKPTEVVEYMIKSGAAKAALPAKDLLIRGFLAGSLLAFATSLAITATIQTGRLSPSL